MGQKRYVVMGAGEVGYHLAQTLSEQGKNVAVIELDPVKQARIEEELDVQVVGVEPAGDGGRVGATHPTSGVAAEGTGLVDGPVEQGDRPGRSDAEQQQGRRRSESGLLHFPLRAVRQRIL